MSTVPNTSTVTVCTKGGKEVMKPQVVIDYNKTMAGVDRVDQAITFYPAMRNSKRSTTRRSSGIFLSNACGMPTFCIEKRVTSLWFIRTSFEKLLNGSLWTTKHHQWLWIDLDVVLLVLSTQKHLTGHHFMDFIPPTEKKSAPTRMCVVCFSKRDDNGKIIWKETRFRCPDCELGLRAVPCFKISHTQDFYWTNMQCLLLQGLVMLRPCLTNCSVFYLITLLNKIILFFIIIYYIIIYDFVFQTLSYLGCLLDSCLDRFKWVIPKNYRPTI